MRVPLVSKMFRVTIYIFLAAGVITVGITGYIGVKNWKDVSNFSYLFSDFDTFMVVFIFFIAILMVWLMVELSRMMKTLWDNPFTTRNVDALFRLGIDILFLVFFFLVKSIFFYTILTVICTAGLLGASLAVFTLQSLFRQAVAYKEEVELTI